MWPGKKPRRVQSHIEAIFSDSYSYRLHAAAAGWELNGGVDILLIGASDSLSSLHVGCKTRHTLLNINVHSSIIVFAFNLPQNTSNRLIVAILLVL